MNSTTFYFPRLIIDVIWRILSLAIIKIMCQNHSRTFSSVQEFLKDRFIGVKLNSLCMTLLGNAKIFSKMVLLIYTLTSDV